MAEIMPSIQRIQPEPETRQPSLGSVSAPALLMVLCMMAALPPAACATMPEAPAHAQRHRGSDPASEPQRRETEDESQIRQISRVLGLGLDTLLGGSTGPPAIVIDRRIKATGRAEPAPLATRDRPPAPARAIPVRECDLPPPAMKS